MFGAIKKWYYKGHKNRATFHMRYSSARHQAKRFRRRLRGR